MFELRWLMTAEEARLQYRQKQSVTNYSMFDEGTGKYVEVEQWTEWSDVPAVEENDTTKNTV